MKYDWILDVLGDLRAFAQANGLTSLAEQLEDTTLIAAVEIASVGGETIGGENPEAGQARRPPGELGTNF